MRLDEVIDRVNADIICHYGDVDIHFNSAFCSDLMSDVLAYVEEDTLLITGLTNCQVVRTSEMLDLKAILFVRGKKPDEAVIELAREKKISLLATHHTLFVTAGLLFEEGLNGIKVDADGIL